MTDTSPTSGQRSDSIRPVMASLRELADSYFRQGRLADSRVVLRAVNQLLALDEIGREEQLSFLLQTATILVAAYFCTNRDDDQMLSIIEQVKSLSEEMLDTRSLADALSLLSQARYFTAVNAASSLSSTDARTMATCWHHSSRRCAYESRSGIAGALPNPCSTSASSTSVSNNMTWRRTTTSG